MKIGFIGGGNMAQAIMQGMLDNAFSANNICVSGPHSEKLTQLKKQFNVNVTQSNDECILQSDIIVLAIKPQVLTEVSTNLLNLDCFKGKQIVSVMAGVPVSRLMDVTGLPASAIIRAMPNTPALIQQGMVGLYKKELAADLQASIESIFNSVGKSVWLASETDVDRVTALSGSGPAYVFWTLDQFAIEGKFPAHLTACLQKAFVVAGQAIGLKADLDLIAKQTVSGALELIRTSRQPLNKLREQVTSKGGTTAAALACLKAYPRQKLTKQLLELDNVVELQNELNEIITLAAEAAFTRACQIAN